MLPRVLRPLILLCLLRAGLAATEPPARLPAGWRAMPTDGAVVLLGPRGERLAVVESALPANQGAADAAALARAELEHHAAATRWQAEGERSIAGLRWARFRCQRPSAAGTETVVLWLHLDGGRLLVASAGAPAGPDADACELALAGFGASRPVLR